MWWPEDEAAWQAENRVRKLRPEENLRVLLAVHSDKFSPAEIREVTEAADELTKLRTLTVGETQHSPRKHQEEM